MAEYRLKVKIGQHEFEAEGPADSVKSQFEAFKELVGSLPAETSISKSIQSPSAESGQPPNGSVNVDRIFHAEGRVVSLTAPPTSETEAALLVLYGQRHYRKNENVTGSEIIDGMEQSGYRTPRIDRILASLADEGAVIVTGAHRGKKYRLTNQGNVRAEGIVREVLGKLP